MPQAIPAVIGVGASLIGASAQKSAAKTAAKTEADMYNQTRADRLPWMQSGVNSLNAINYMLGLPPQVNPFDPTQPAPTTTKGKNGKTIAAVAQPAAPYQPPPGVTFGEMSRPWTMADMALDPGYQFRMDEGQRAIERSSAARTGALSGRALKEANRWSQNFASEEAGNAFNRFQTDKQNRFNRFASIADKGQAASDSSAAIGSATAGRMSNIALQKGNIGAQQAVTIGNTIGDFYSAYQNRPQQIYSPVPEGITPYVPEQIGPLTMGSLAISGY